MSTAIAKRNQSSIESMRSALATCPTKGQIAEVVGVLVAGCARSAELDETEAELRLRLIAEVLSRYPLCVVQAAADPYAGLLSRHTFLPAVHEVKAFCEERIAARLSDLRRAEQEREREEDARREREWAEAQPPADERAARVEAVLRKHGFKRMPGPLPRATADEISSWCELVPDAPTSP